MGGARFDNDPAAGNDSEDDEDQDEMMQDIRDDILKPASTRSKIVVTLKIPDEVKKGNREWRYDDPIEYELDPYDKVRMRLLRKDEELFKAYENTI